MTNIKEIFAKHGVPNGITGQQFEDLCELTDDLMTFYVNGNDMPYGTMKARTGDPYQWMFDRLDSEGLILDE